MRKILTLLLCVTLAVSLCGCLLRVNPFFPEERKLTKWETSDGRVVFYVSEQGRAFGTIRDGDEEYDAFFLFWGGGFCTVELTNGEEVEEWIYRGGFWEPFHYWVRRSRFLDDDLIESEYEITLDLTKKSVPREEIPEIPERALFPFIQAEIAVNQFPLSMWQTEDERITIYVSEKGECYGTVNTGKEEVPVICNLADEYFAWFYYTDDGSVAEYWYLRKVVKNGFTYTVSGSLIYDEYDLVTLVMVRDHLLPEELPPMGKAHRSQLR